ncbi:anhydro-N-acetylmuramic acid kinase [Odoribacter sp. OttesenSCG-928-L07]|nr:anhydro-N-acetylmuramic acid kinase [Odoribacter sp. OttesenSCG-928-L07]MDL2238974.1 anhydro-N-acetylmuramic acid kinase [Bacteroidales bacterium OttesenSCG-928-L14]MDL2240873.1 anhydro-N-acetylmuramic acid kinase [Bacteroidales bacterium OttesenSCG-928-K22]
MQNKYNIIGLMSGTSRDGLDIAYCSFWFTDKWNYKINIAETIPYPNYIHKLLDDAFLRNKLESCDNKYGSYLGEQVNLFCERHNINPDFVASHGHTIFHQPEKSYTLQIGNGKVISEICKKTVIYDFRSKDVMLGGQGAPLVPIGDDLLFSDFDSCINIGGFSNISFNKNINGNKIRIAFDICPANIVLNELATLVGKEFDKDGEIARDSKIIPELLEELNNLEYYKISAPKSLGKEYVENYIQPILNKYKNKSRIEDIISTYTEHIAIQISKHIKNKEKNLITGGGALNKHLIERIKYHTNNKNIIIPKEIIINYKEALIFAFMGILRMRNEVNVYCTVTGAKCDHCAGEVEEYNKITELQN